ncbi:MAG: hypothetical protein DBY39_01320 [Clostridiales bacterium]|nr:MAG: hypothetical protein DBY39_01320 [Clostridiales bacterium]
MGRCKIHACAKEHEALFCGLCIKFPCEKAESLMPWKRNCRSLPNNIEA